MTDTKLQEYILGTIPTDENKIIKGSRLPTEHQVLLCYLAHRQCPNISSKREAANETVNVVIPFYEKAGIPTLHKQKMAEAVESLLAEFEKILKTKKTARNSGKPKERIEEFKKKIKEKTMKFWPRNALKIITNEEDKKFLLSMMSDREASMGGKDTISIGQAKRKLAINNQKMKQKKLYEEEAAACSISVVLSDSTTTDASTDDEAEPFYNPAKTARNHKKLVKTGVDVHIPSNILKAPRVVQALVRNQVSSSAISAIMHDIITTADGDPSKLSLSYATTERYKLETIQTISEKISKNWKPPLVANLHWDGKLMDTLDGSTKTERLPILLSGLGGVKLLGVPAIPHKSSNSAGSLIAKASDELIKIWDCKNNISGMVFDTTSSNTGAQTAACVALQSTLSKPLLWFACRHHVGEIVLSHVWNVLKIEASKSPEISIFQRFKEFFPSIPSAVEHLDYFYEPHNLSDRKQEIVELCHNYLKQPCSRGDYKELVKLALLYLGDPTTKANYSTFNRPGALNKARWMSKLLYAIKMDLLGSSICNFLKGTIHNTIDLDIFVIILHFVRCFI